MGYLMRRAGLAIAVFLLGSGPALAEPSPDRSGLSYDENVTVNIACAGAHARSDSAFSDCVNQQLAALKAHPSPDRTGLAPDQNKTIEDKCAYLRRSGIGDYNECMKQAMAAPPPAEADADDGLVPNYSQVFTQGKVELAKSPAKTPPDETKDKQAAKPADKPVDVAELPVPQKVLPKRPDHASGQPLSPADLFKKVERSVFLVAATPSLADAKARDIVFGSAIAVSDHLLLTNCHVVDGRDLIKIIQESTVTDAKLVAEDLDADRCVIRADNLALVPVPGVRPFADLVVGERVFAIGSPMTLERTLSEGLVSGLRHQPDRNLVQTSAPISHGSSGGGLFDERGNLIGITTLGSTAAAQNLNFAIAAADYWD